MKRRQKQRKKIRISMMLCATLVVTSLSPFGTTSLQAATVEQNKDYLSEKVLASTFLSNSSIKLQSTGHTDIVQSSLKASADSAQEAAANAIDGNSSTKWHTSWSEGHTTVPLSIILELDATCQDLTQLRYLPRQDKKGQDYQWNGDILNYEIWVSAIDTEESSFQKVAEGSWAEDKEEKCASFSPVSAKYVKLTAIHTKGNNANEYDQYASAAEIDLASGGTVDLEADKKGLTDAIAKAQAYLEGVGADETGTAVLRGLLEKGNTIAAYQCPVEEELQEITQAILTETNRLETGAPAITYDNFTPNSQWMDNTNVMIQAHGGGIIWDEKTQKY